MRDAVVCEPVRTAVGAFGGMYRDVPAHELAATVIAALLERTGLDPGRVDDVVLGQCYPNGEAPAIGRVAALDAGMPVTVPGLQLDRRCGSGLQAVLDAAMRVQTGVAEVVVAGGAESMSQAEHYVLGARWGVRGDGALLDRLGRGRVTAGGRHHPVPGGMLETAENLRREYAIPREAQDRLADTSHHRAAAAQRDGRFAQEIVPVTVADRRRGEVVLDTDEHVRPDSSLEKLATLRPVRRRQDPEATVTAGNASGQNDGASVCLVTSVATADELGLRPLARLVSWGVGAVEPSRMGIGPVPATAAALGRAGLSLGDLDLVELNEAFAAQAFACLNSWPELDRAIVNPNGGAIAIGHPIGASGARILTTLVHELARRGGGYGLATMCIGVGQGIAVVVEAS